MNNLYDELEICLQELEKGTDLDVILARYPDLASELRPILKASIQARTMSVSAPTPDAIRRGRAKLLQHASELREAKVAPRRRMIPVFQRLAISFSLAALFLVSGTGLVSASSSALPGENLYPVKLTWENLRLLFTFNNEYRETLEYTFEDERLHEINELLAEGRHETIRFSGTYMEVNGIAYVSGIHIVVLDTSSLPSVPLLNGAAVIVTGHTNAQGFIDVESIMLLPEGSVVPTGEPVEVEAEHGGDDVGNFNESTNINDNTNTNDNANENIDENTNSNDNDGMNNNDNTDGNSNSNGNDNVDTSGNDTNGNDSNSNDSNSNDSNSNDSNSNGDGGDNGNDNSGNDSVNDNSIDNSNDNSGSNDNSDDNSGSDSGGDDGNDNSDANDNNDND